LLLLHPDEASQVLGFLPLRGRMPGDLLQDGVRVQAGLRQGLLLQASGQGTAMPGLLLQVRSL
jgi:hypothetical protein